ncbi:XTP/dITP diphosphohydrolase [Clostridium punense]|uniref:dITP/XTP pyrophosphatase n=1 Tax=Clostridium punense TaxID=1054297 RepID=A0ABS4K6F9_9CLOT|nr:XTP/dITP diphosphatase [Clostridium punense]MBP2022219.1 XTP/dITP diphosphohydrolase [Clostridium punense]
MKKLIVASNNNHKIGEIKEMLKEFPLEVIGLKEAGINIDVDETGKSFMENAEIKAKEIFSISEGQMVLADDSGLSVEALNGEPGIYSARYSGEHGNDIENNKKLIRELQGVPFDERAAKFICAMVLIVDKNNVIKVQGEVNGFILEEYREKQAFGYDPLFYVPELKETFADVSSEIKNSMSHRGRALDMIKKELSNYLK